MEKPVEWVELLAERDQQEVRLSRLYAEEFHHGTSGHIEYMLIASLAEMLDRVEKSGVDIKKLYESQ